MAYKKPYQLVIAAGFLVAINSISMVPPVRSPKDTDMRIVGDLNPIFQHGANLRVPGRRSQVSGINKPLGFMGIGMVYNNSHKHQLNVGKCLRWWFLKYFLEFSSRKLGK